MKACLLQRSQVKQGYSSTIFRQAENGYEYSCPIYLAILSRTIIA